LGYILSGDFDGHPTIIKTDQTGLTTWMKSYSIPGISGYESGAIETMDNGLAIVCRGPSIIKADSVGNVLWAKNYELMDESITYMSVHPLIQTSDSGFVVLFTFKDTIGPTETYNVSLLRTDKYGTPLWGKTYKDRFDTGGSVKQTDDGGFIICGHSGFTNPNSSFLIKTNGNGNVLWSKNYGDTLSIFNFGMDVVQMNDGGYAFCGGRGIPDADVSLIRTDQNGITSCDYFQYPIQESSLNPRDSNIIVSSFPSNLTVTSFMGASFPYGMESDCSTAEISNVEQEPLFVFPNPSTGMVTISSKNSGKVIACLFDLSGKKVVEKVIYNLPSEIKFDCLPGMYFLNISDDKRSSTIKMIFQ
jgi:Secretion system C-terminal sorting domain